MSQSFNAIKIAENITLHIPDTWKTEEGDPDEYAFHNEDRSVNLTATFLKLDATEPFSPEETLEDIAANFTKPPDLEHLKDLFDLTEFPDMPDIKELLTLHTPKLEVIASPIIKTEKYIAKQVQMAYQTMLLAFVPVEVADGKIVAYLMFQSEDMAAYENEKAAVIQILEKIEIE